MSEDMDKDLKATVCELLGWEYDEHHGRSFWDNGRERIWDADYLPTPSLEDHARAICYAIENCPAGEHQTTASLVASRFLERLKGRGPDCLEKTNAESNKELLEALKAVVAVADRNTVEFDRARAAIAKAERSTP